MDFEQAEELKLNGSPFPPPCEKAVSNHFKDLSTEIQQTITFFANSNTDIRIDSIERILLSGGGASTHGLREALVKSLKTSVEFVDPFHGTENSAQVLSCVGTMPHLFSVAFGLALRRIGDRES
jgi:Tfp pilus assembly PilM family ATPase